MLDCLDPATISIVLVEDDLRIREGLRVLLEGTSGFRCINAWRSMEEALAHHWNPMPAVALIDIGLPGISGIEGLALLRERYPAVALLMLTVFDDDERIFNALCAGACGYLLKGTPPTRLLESIREVVAGGAPMSPEIARDAAVSAARALGRPKWLVVSWRTDQSAGVKLLASNDNN
jgi:DNA-binding NarL/FixJ family response regulator